MQSEAKDIYKITSVRTGINEQIYKDIGNFVFKQVPDNLKNPKSLILRLKGLGYFFLKRKRMTEFIGYYPEGFENEVREFTSEESKSIFLRKQELYKIFKARLLDYDEYLKIKAEIKLKKDEFKKLQGGQKEGDSSSQDNP